jgi:hypothetical protein
MNRGESVLDIQDFSALLGRFWCLHCLQVIDPLFKSREAELKTMLSNRWALVLAVMLLGACAAPTWEGISETEIGAWKDLNLGPGDAQAYRAAGLDAKAVSLWSDKGFKTVDDVLAWHKAGFGAEEAGAWKNHGFAMDRAVAWKKAKFNPDNAKEWKGAGFNLEDATKNRDKGLSPIK